MQVFTYTFECPYQIYIPYNSSMYELTPWRPTQFLEHSVYKYQPNLYIRGFFHPFSKVVFKSPIEWFSPETFIKTKPGGKAGCKDRENRSHCIQIDLSTTFQNVCSNLRFNVFLVIQVSCHGRPDFCNENSLGTEPVRNIIYTVCAIRKLYLGNWTLSHGATWLIALFGAG